VRADQGQLRQRRGRRGVGTAPVVLPQRRHRLPPRRRRRRLALRQAHPLRVEVEQSLIQVLGEFNLLPTCRFASFLVS
jgi:hypothetical protein